MRGRQTKESEGRRKRMARRDPRQNTAANVADGDGTYKSAAGYLGNRFYKGGGEGKKEKRGDRT